MTSHAINQRDLRMRSREIMDAVERGETFTITRDGREVAELVPLKGRRRFVPAAEFLALGRGLQPIDAEQFRADLDGISDPYLDDPFDR